MAGHVCCCCCCCCESCFRQAGAVSCLVVPIGFYLFIQHRIVGISPRCPTIVSQDLITITPPVALSFRKRGYSMPLLSPNSRVSCERGPLRGGVLDVSSVTFQTVFPSSFPMRSVVALPHLARESPSRNRNLTPWDVMSTPTPYEYTDGYHTSASPPRHSNYSSGLNPSG